MLCMVFIKNGSPQGSCVGWACAIKYMDINKLMLSRTLLIYAVHFEWIAAFLCLRLIDRV